MPVLSDGLQSFFTSHALRGPNLNKFQADIVQNTIEGLVKSGISPMFIIHGLHNAMCHGDLLKEWSDTEEMDQYLGEFFDGLTVCEAAMKKMMV